MLNLELKNEIINKLGQDKEFLAMVSSRDIPGILAKCQEAGIEVTEGDVAEYVVGSDELSAEELDSVSGGCGTGPYGCGKASCHSDKDL